MRDIRDKVSIETANMTLKELKKYIKKNIKISGLTPIGQ